MYADTKFYLKDLKICHVWIAQSWKKQKHQDRKRIFELWNSQKKEQSMKWRTLQNSPQLHVIFLCLLEVQGIIALDDTMGDVSCFFFLGGGFPETEKKHPTHVSNKWRHASSTCNSTWGISSGFRVTCLITRRFGWSSNPEVKRNFIFSWYFFMGLITRFHELWCRQPHHFWCFFFWNLLVSTKNL